MNKTRAYSYFILGCILLFGVGAFYFSCKSKTPTEPTSPSSGTAAVRSTSHAARTTTTSSVPAAIRSGKSQTNTSTIITSRYLTTTTSTTSTTSIPATTTTSIIKSTTSIGSTADVRFCKVYGLFYPFLQGPSWTDIKRGDTVYITPGYTDNIYFTIKNVGGEPARVKAYASTSKCSSYFSMWMTNGTKFFKLRNDGVCKTYSPTYGLTQGDLRVGPAFPPGILMVSFDADVPDGECCKITIELEWKGQLYKPKFSFTLCAMVPE